MFVESVVITLDGESKAGKTAILEHIDQEATFQEGIVSDVLASPDWEDSLNDETRQSLQDFADTYFFKSITTVVVGEYFRAAALHLALLDLNGQHKTEFTLADEEALRDILAVDGIKDILQQDPNIGKSVSRAAQLPGVQRLCGRMMCEAVVGAFHTESSGNLVMIDARDPVGHLIRGGVIGEAEGQIPAGAIMPFYVETPPEVAASRMSGDYEERLAEVNNRRYLDATREELPVIRPGVVLTDLGAYLDQFRAPRTTIAEPLLIDNGSHTELANIQYMGGVIAGAAHDNAIFRAMWQRDPMSVPQP
jgi:hypothetical protein